MNANFKELTDKGDAWLNAEKISEERKVIIRHADMRYYGQNFELSVNIPYEEITEENIGAIRDLFHQVHKREYGYCNEGALVQIVNYRVTAIGRVQTIELVEDGTILYSMEFMGMSMGVYLEKTDAAAEAPAA